MTFGIYAGSFDPITTGHMWMIQRGCELFNKFMILVGVNPAKKYTFSIDERLEMVCDGLPSHVQCLTIGNSYLVDVADSVGASHLLRGVRSSADFEYERQMRNVNSDRVPWITTVLLTPPRSLCEVSSSMVKGLVGPSGWEKLVSQYVPTVVMNKLIERSAKL